jgi:hypothetical protein
MSNDTPENPGSTLASVEIITEGYGIIGNCRGLSEHLRLIDFLNNPEVTHLQLADVNVRQLLTLGEVIASEGPFFVDKGSVVLGRSLASPQAEARRNEAHRLDHVEKAKRRMLVFAPPFRILGNIHMIKDADITVALPKLFEGFLAMTEAKTIHEAESGLAWDDEFIVVNGRHIEMVCVVPPGYRQVDLAGAGPTEKVEERDAQAVSGAVE